MSDLIIDEKKPLGEYQAIFLARSKLSGLRGREQRGGKAVTALLIYLLDKGIIDAVVTTKRTRGLEGQIVIAKTKKEVLESVGTRWSVLPYTTKLKEALLESDIKRVAIVGLPCQTQFLRQAQLYPLLEADIGRKIEVIISLFCMGTYATEAFVSFLRKKYALAPGDIVSIQLVGDYLEIMLKDNIKRISTRDILPYVQLGCLICSDYTGVFSDVSAGLSEKKAGYTVLIVRTSKMLKLINKAYQEGYLELEEANKDIIIELNNKAQQKILRAKRYIQEYII